MGQLAVLAALAAAAAAPQAGFALPASGTTSAAATVTSCTAASDWGTSRADFAARVVDLVNAHRAARGLGALAVSPTLTASAEWKSLHMAKYGYFGHSDPAPPVDRTFGQRVVDCGYRAGSAGENIAYGYATPEAVMNGWLNSPGHR